MIAQETIKKNQTQNDLNQQKFSYYKRLLDPFWLKKRKEILERDHHRCQNCGSTNELHVHHRQYHNHSVDRSIYNPWEYDAKYLVTLCNKCHKQGHKNYKVPVFSL